MESATVGNDTQALVDACAPALGQLFRKHQVDTSRAAVVDPDVLTKSLSLKFLSSEAQRASESLAFAPGMCFGHSCKPLTLTSSSISLLPYAARQPSRSSNDVFRAL